MNIMKEQKQNRTTMNSITKYAIEWETEETEKLAFAWYPNDEDINTELDALLNLACLDASETGHGYNIWKETLVFCQTCQDYFYTRNEDIMGDKTDPETKKVTRVKIGIKTITKCLECGQTNETSRFGELEAGWSML